MPNGRNWQGSKPGRVSPIRSDTDQETTAACQTPFRALPAKQQRNPTAPARSQHAVAPSRRHHDAMQALDVGFVGRRTTRGERREDRMFAAAADLLWRKRRANARCRSIIRCRSWSRRRSPDCRRFACRRAPACPWACNFLGPRGDDLAVLQLGALYHQATDWPSRHPSGLDTSSVYSAG